MTNYREKYQKLQSIGEGTYSNVYYGKISETGEEIAIKKIKLAAFSSGIEISALREIKHLQKIQHPNIIKLIDVFMWKANLNLVLEYLVFNLEDIIKNRSVVFTAADIKSWMLMLIRGLDACHKNWILHRDLKPNNLLIDSNGNLKIADFGLARDYGTSSKMTSQVVTRWYRAPELLFGARHYSVGVDIWAVGCIFAELMLRTPYLPGESDIGQLQTIYKALGSPKESDWPGMSSLPDYLQPSSFPKPPLKDLFKAASSSALDLLENMLRYDPLKRLDTREILGHKYFQELPRPTAPEKLPTVIQEKSSTSFISSAAKKLRYE